MYVEGEKNIVGEPTRSGKTSLQVAQETEGSPENLEWKKGQLRSKMMPMKKKLIRLRMGAVQKRFNEGEEAVHKSVDAISSMEALESALKSAGYSPVGF